MSDWVNVLPAEVIGSGEARVVDLDGTRVAIFNLGGTLYAIEDVCTHDGGELASGCLEGDQIICPRHGARFSVRTGEALTAPAYEPTHVFPVRTMDGAVQLRDDRWD